MKKYQYIPLLGLFCGIMQGVLLAVAPANINDQNLFAQRSIGLVMLNDTYENYKKKGDTLSIYPWVSSSIFSQSDVLVKQMIDAFASDQAVLCTKTLWYQIQLFARLWDDFLNLEIEVLLEKYLEFGTSSQDLYENIEKYQNMVAEFDSLYRSDMVKDHLQRDRFLAVFAKYDGTTQSNILFFQAAYQAYNYVTNLSNYRCYDVNDWYLLFVPHRLLGHQTVAPFPIEYIISDPDASWQGMISGLNLKLPQSIQYRQYISPQQEVSIMQNCPTDDTLGEYAIDAVSKVLINKHTIQRNFLEFASFLLPTIHVFIIGHGDFNNHTLGMKTPDVFAMLQAINHRALVGSISLVSCYLGGKNLKNLSDMFDREAATIQRNKIVQDFNFPIIFASSFYAIFQKIDPYYQYIYRFHKMQEDRRYEKFFDTLSTQEDTTSVPPPHYVKAMNILFDFLDQEGMIRPKDLHKYVSIKFPKMPFIHAYDYDKKVQSIAPIGASYQDVITIKNGVRIVLLKTDTILAPIEIPELIDLKQLHGAQQLSWQTFLPVNYLNQEYYIHQISIPNVKGLHDDELLKNIWNVLYHLFFTVSTEVQYIGEHICILIQDLQLGDVRLSNLVLFVSDRAAIFELVEPAGIDSGIYAIGHVKGAWYKDKIDGSRGVHHDEALKKRNDVIERIDHRIKNSAADNHRNFLIHLNATLQKTQETLPDTVKKSRTQYQAMTLDQRAEQVQTKKDTRGLNPYAKKFVPPAHLGR